MGLPARGLAALLYRQCCGGISAGTSNAGAKLGSCCDCILCIEPKPAVSLYDCDDGAALSRAPRLDDSAHALNACWPFMLLDMLKLGAGLLLLALLIPAAVYTRYDGWILGAAVWCVLTFTLARRGDVWRKVAPSFVVFTLFVVAAPLSWLAYNQHFAHDPLDFIRGPYSAAAIEKKTMPPNGHHHRGWHNPAWALLFYTRTAQVDAAFWETGFLVMAAAVAGLVLAIRRRLALSSLLLWMPLPFYIYSIAYGSVPIFIPQLWPHSYYNSRYGMEMLPALTIFSFVAVAWVEVRWSETQPLAKRLLQPIALLLIALSTVGMMYRTPLVLKEALVNSTTRVAFETALARQLRAFPDGSTILMYNSDHVGCTAGRGDTTSPDDQRGRLR